jgi:hypothetical protein
VGSASGAGLNAGDITVTSAFRFTLIDSTSPPRPKKLTRALPSAVSTRSSPIKKSHRALRPRFHDQALAIHATDARPSLAPRWR